MLVSALLVSLLRHITAAHSNEPRYARKQYPTSVYIYTLLPGGGREPEIENRNEQYYNYSLCQALKVIPKLVWIAPVLFWLKKKKHPSEFTKLCMKENEQK